MATADTDEALFCFPEHGPELAAEDTIGAADNFLRHYCWFSFIVITSFSSATVELQGSGELTRGVWAGIPGVVQNSKKYLRRNFVTLEHARLGENGPIG